MRNFFLVVSSLMLSLSLGCGGGGVNITPPTRVKILPEITPDRSPSYFAEMRPSLRWPKSKPELIVFVGLDGEIDRSARVLEGMRLWSLSTGNLVTFRQAASPGDADIEVVFKDTVPGGEAGLGSASLRFNIVPGNTTEDGIITHSNIELKRGQSDALLVLVTAHEAGHALGLVNRNSGDSGHSTDTNDLMFTIVTNESFPTVRDVNTLAKLYDLPR
jgi:hypothetical protein